jgi:hypothetical protein
MAWGTIKKVSSGEKGQYGYIKDEKGQGVYFDVADVVGIDPDELDPEELAGAVVHFSSEDKDWGKQAKRIVLAE